jgi:hypothetical protein
MDCQNKNSGGGGGGGDGGGGVRTHYIPVEPNPPALRCVEVRSSKRLTK